MSILEEFWRGEIFPCEQFLKQGSEYFEELHKMADEHEKMLAEVSREQRQWAEKLLQMQSHVNCFAERDAFVYGFRMAVQMMFEGIAQAL